jgi:uncharacterized protein YutE (UPF0331/DUF86 family)
MSTQSHLRELNAALEDWERYQGVSLRELEIDRDKRNMVLHAMLVSVQATIDIASHLIAEKGLSKPATYRESFEILGKSGLMGEELASELSDLAGFRNVLVHVYWGLDLEEVYGVLQNDLRVLRAFRDEVKELLRQ